MAPEGKLRSATELLTLHAAREASSIQQPPLLPSPAVSSSGLGALLGEGGHAKAYLFTNGDGIFGVVKIGRDKVKDRAIVKEAELLRTLTHQNILRVVAFHDGLPMFEYCEDGDFGHVMENQRPVEEVSFLTWGRQVASALLYIHDRSVLHRDVKPENVFLTKSRQVAILGDFGAAREGAVVSSLAGSPLYHAPEVRAGYIFTTASDMWAFGVTFRQMLQSVVVGPIDKKAEAVLTGCKAKIVEDRSSAQAVAEEFGLALARVRRGQRRSRTASPEYVALRSPITCSGSGTSPSKPGQGERRVSFTSTADSEGSSRSVSMCYSSSRASTCCSQSQSKTKSQNYASDKRSMAPPRLLQTQVSRRFASWLCKFCICR